jgi:ArsR family transcriptional regulator, lead/cadmium/zinc/bismuth-responsive transcriptional repressor
MKSNQCIRVMADARQIKSCKEKIKEVDQSIHLLANAFNLAGNEVRLKILFLINEEKKVCVCDMSDILGMNISAISQHLRKLKDGGVISFEKTGQTIYYSLTPEYARLFKSFFVLIAKNKVAEEIA